MSEQNARSNGAKSPLSPVIIIVIGICAAIVAVALGALLWMFVFTARTRTVDGLKNIHNPDGSVNSAYSEEGIFFSAGIGENTGFLFINPAKAEAKLTQALPYIESAQIIKKYPSKVIIRPVYTRAAFAADIAGTGVYTLFSPSLKVLDTACVVLPDNVTVVKGLDFGELTAGKQAVIAGKDNKTDIVKELYARLTATYAPDRIKMIDVSSTLSIRFVFAAEHTVTVNLGDKSDMEKKLKLAGDSIEYTLTHGFNRNATLDISNVDGAIYHPEPVTGEDVDIDAQKTEDQDDGYYDDEDYYDYDDGDDYDYDEDEDDYDDGD